MKNNQHRSVKQTHPNFESLSSQFYDVLENDTGYGCFLKKVPHNKIQIDEGVLACAVVFNGTKYLVYNFHPLSKHWKQVYSLERCNVEEQLVQSIESLKRLYTKE